MCGIVGVASRLPQSERSWLTLGRERLSHRGPDDSDEWWSGDGRVGLGHTRLSILELSSLGRQPMHLMERGLSIVFNGEIYNFADLRRELEALGHIFCSHGDTEVLLVAYAQWGTDFISRLNGMFAFALYDSKSQVLLIGRDRAGEKPLFYRLSNDTIYFASELKGILENPDLPRQIDAASLDCYLAMGFVPAERCILKGYNKLPPAHALRFDLQNAKLEIWRYWELPQEDATNKFHDDSELLEELERLLEDSVGRQLVADVPVGILLSGGVDSSLITAMAARRSTKVRTFSVGFPGHGAFDEVPHARLIANHFGTEHTELLASSASADLLPVLARQFDEPIVDSSMLPTYLLSQLVRQHCSVALGGDGGDELFGGYRHYSRLLWMKRRFSLIPSFIRHMGAQFAEHYLPVGLKGRNYLQSINVNLEHGLPLIASYFDATQRGQLLNRIPNHRLVAENIRILGIPECRDILQRATRMDFNNYLANDILVKIDRASMLSSLEIRAPFLDIHMLEFAFGSVPSSLKASEHSSKIILKRLAAKVLPPRFDNRRKQGFSIPMAAWLKEGSFRNLFWDTLNSADCMFDAKSVHKMFSGQDRGRNNGERLFALVQFELWRKAYNATY